MNWMSHRRATDRDRIATRAIVERAFASDAEPLFLDRLREHACLIGEWLTEDRSEPIAYIAFSRVWIAPSNGQQVPAALLAPLAVLPDQQRRGVGAGLTQFALHDLDGRGECLFLVLGHPAYYPRFGFRQVASDEIMGPWTGRQSFLVRGEHVPPGQLVLPDVIAATP